MITLSEHEQILALKSKNLILEKDGHKYFIKENDCLSELLGEYLANILGIRCAHYEHLNILNSNFVISPDLNEIGKFTPTDILTGTSNFKNSLPYFINLIAFRYNVTDIEELQRKLITIFLYDILFLNNDRYPKNWGIIESENGDIDIVILDNSNIFNNDTPPLMSSSLDSDSILSLEENLETFLSVYGIEGAELLREMLNKIPPEYFSELIVNVETRYQVKIKKKKTYKYLYRNNYANVLKILENYRGEIHAR